jgi:hypothetical protein
MAVGGPAVSSTAMTGWVDGSLAMIIGIRPKMRASCCILYQKPNP